MHTKAEREQAEQRRMTAARWFAGHVHSPTPGPARGRTRRGATIAAAKTWAFIRYHPDERRVRPLTGHTLGAYNTVSLIATPQYLPALLGGDPAILVWDGLPSHRSIATKSWLARRSRWLSVVRLPGYAPELNPVEGLWSAADVTDLRHTAQRGPSRIRRNPALLWAFLGQTGLTIP